MLSKATVINHNGQCCLKQQLLITLKRGSTAATSPTSNEKDSELVEDKELRDKNSNI